MFSKDIKIIVITIATTVIVFSVLGAAFIGSTIGMPAWNVFLMIISILGFFALLYSLVILVFYGHWKKLEKALEKKNRMKSLFILNTVNWGLYFIFNLINNNEIIEGIVVIIMSTIGFLGLHYLWKIYHKNTDYFKSKKFFNIFWTGVWGFFVFILFVMAGYGLLRILVIDIVAVFGFVEWVFASFL